MYRLTVYLPESHLESVKQALFNAGAGRVGAYDCCAWQTLGQGQFRPLADSQPFLGRPGEVEIVAEYQLEVVCQAEQISAIIAALKASHPYETPAYMVSKLEDC
jgi:hypothetical protein